MSAMRAWPSPVFLRLRRGSTLYLRMRSRCIATIGKSGADICFVALGAPKQELFADYGKRLLPNISFVCIGAGLDFIAGAQVRAPSWMQRWGLEWLWRAASDPQRLLRRYLLCMGALPGILARAALVPRRR